MEADEREFAAENAFRAEEPMEKSKMSSLKDDSIFGGPEEDKDTPPK